MALDILGQCHGAVSSCIVEQVVATTFLVEPEVILGFEHGKTAIGIFVSDFSVLFNDDLCIVKIIEGKLAITQVADFVQVIAAVESISIQVSKGGGEGDGFKIGAVIECAAANLLYIVADYSSSQSGTIGECAGAKVCNTVRNDDFLQAFTIRESVASNGSDRIAKCDGLQGSTARKSIVWNLLGIGVYAT